MAVTTESRRTGLIARVVDTNLNSWQDFAGIDINIPATYQPVDTTGDDKTDGDHWSYRGQAAVCQLADGSIVRVRIGDWTATSERRIQRQIITDPTDPSQWTTWSWLAYGDNYAIAIERDDAAAAGYRIYHSKTDGLYRDNVKIYTTGAAGAPITRIKPVAFKTNMIGLQILQTAADDNPFITWVYLVDTVDFVGSFADTVEDPAAYFQYHHDQISLQGATGHYYRFRAMPMFNSERSPTSSDTLTVDHCFADDPITDSEWGIWDNVRYLKGPSKRSGFTRIDDMYFTAISDADYPGGAYYLFYTEQEMDAFGSVLSNLKKPLYFSRSVGYPYYLSAPTPVGFSIWGFAGVVVSGGYVYLCGNGRVLRRPLDPTVIDVTNYVKNGGYELPRDNGKGTGKLALANPNNIVGAQLGMTAETDQGLTDRRVDFGIGLRRLRDDFFYFKRDARWWISSLAKSLDEEGKDTLTIGLSDFWHKMENPFLHSWLIPGHFEWADWQPDAENQLFNYSNANDETTQYAPVGADPATVPRIRATSSGAGPRAGSATLFTGLAPTENALVSARFWGGQGGFVFRYIDADNYSVLWINSGGAYIEKVSEGLVGEGTPTQNPDAGFVHAANTASWAKATTPMDVTLDYRWNRINVWLNGTQIFSDVFMFDYAPAAGFVGLFSYGLLEVSNFSVSDFNQIITTRELLKMLLCYVDEPAVLFELDEETLAAPQLETLWGPQSDLESPEKAARQLLEASGLNIVFRQDT